MPELSQTEYELLELEAIEARTRFLELLAESPRAFAAWQVLQRAERAALEGRRARREAEVFGG